MLDADDEIDIEDMKDDIEPGCNFGHVVAKEIKELGVKVDDLHQSLYRNGYIDDIKKLRRYVKEKESEKENRIDFRQKAKIASISAVIGGGLTPLVAWLLSMF